MTTWLALLRGVNVNGVTVKMAELRACLDAAGLSNAKTVLASGNALFDADGAPTTATRTRLKTQLEAALRETFGYDAWIVLVTLDEVRAIVDAFPYDADDPAIAPYVLFGSDQAALDELLDAAPKLDPTVEAIARGHGAIYWRCPKGRTLDTPFAKLTAKARFKTSTTNRNLRTLVKVLAAANSAG